MTDKRIPMTPEGKKTLEDKLKHFKSVERPKNIKAIEVARELGDLSENADYDAAKNHQGLLNSQIQDVEARLALAQVIDPKTIDSEKIVFGATVTVCDVETDEKLTYQIVGVHEADLAHGKISIESPIARALIGKEAGDEVQFKTPKGVRELDVVSVEYK